MKIVEERKALEAGFERLQRIYKEWERNPSALVRDSLKKYLIECYDHLLNLDRIDIDAGILEEKIMAGESIPEPRMVNHTPPPEDKVVNEEPRIEHIEEMEEVTNEQIETPTLDAQEEEMEAPMNSTEIDHEEEMAAEEVEMTADDSQEISLEAMVNKEEAQQEVELNPEDVYLSGDEEREIEEYFKNNFAESQIDEAANKIIEETPIQLEEEETIENEMTEEQPVLENEVMEEEMVEETEEVVAEEEVAEVEEETTVVAEEEMEEAEEELANEPIAETTEEVETPAEVNMEEIIKEEEDEEPAKSRWSSFFSKDEPKPYENAQPEATGQQQLTLADKLALGTEEKGAHYEMKEQGVTDLNAAIPIAKKFEFIRELFGDDSTNYKSAVANINEAGSLQIALDISENLAETYNWANKEKLAGEFNVFVNRRFAE